MTSINSYSGLGLSTAATTNTNTLGQAEFLKLMTTQMTHQDPTKPMQNGEFLTQMAQFGTVSGIQDLQQSFKNFSASISSVQALQAAASLVGKTVSTLSDRGLLETGGRIKGTVDLPASSSSVNVKILDPVTGAVIATKSLGAQSAGSVPFVWDGMDSNGHLALPGVYKVQVEASIGGTNTVLQPEIQARVESVSMNSNNGLQIKLVGLGTISYNQITQIL